VAWTVAGFGIGLAYSPISVTVLREAPSGQEGAATSGMQLTDTLGITLGTGLGGAAVGLGDAVGWAPESGIGIAWAMTAVMCIVGVVVGRRLPGLPVQPEERRGVPAEDGGLPLG